MKSTAIPEFSSRLLAWFDRHGRKDLPWQQPRTPYRVWISEIMLQQTQVSTVIPYFERWMQRFPDLPTLAAAPLDEVLAHWAGLGYYARARNLHCCARICQQQFDGQLPATAQELAELPGIGRSTANAILSLSTGQPAAILDGNVRRVLARHTGLEAWPGSAAGLKRLWAEAEQRLPQSRGNDYSQAIMDLGALLCTRSKPRCADCPVSEDCTALAMGAVDRLPVAKPATRVSQRKLFWLALLDEQQRILLQQRPPAGIWGGLWTLPEAASLQELEVHCGMNLTTAHRLDPREHRLSHVAMSIHPIVLSRPAAKQVVSNRQNNLNESSQQRWFELAADGLPAIPKPLAQLLEEIREQFCRSGTQVGALS